MCFTLKQGKAYPVRQPSGTDVQCQIDDRYPIVSL
jgi:hypothetical protein